MADDDDRWTIRGVAKEVQEQAKAAAARARVSIGAYVTSAIDGAIEAERKPIEFVVDARDVASPAPMDHRRMYELDDIERTIAAAVALAGAADVPVAFRRRANRVLRERLPGPPGRPPGHTGQISIHTGRTDDTAIARGVVAALKRFDRSAPESETPTS